MDTLAVRLAVPLTGSAEDFHLQGVRPAGRTNEKAHNRNGYGLLVFIKIICMKGAGLRLQQDQELGVRHLKNASSGTERILSRPTQLSS